MQARDGRSSHGRGSCRPVRLVYPMSLREVKIPATWLNASTPLRLHVGDACEAEQRGVAWCIAEC